MGDYKHIQIGVGESGTDTQAAFDRALSELPSYDRALFIMNETMGYSVPEISCMLSRTEESVQTSLQRIRLELKRSI